MKKNCKNTKEFFEEFDRMCAYHCGDCGNCVTEDGIVCPLYEEDTVCTNWIFAQPEIAVKLVQKWSDDHQPETVLEHICKLLPNCNFDTSDVCCQQLDCTIKKYNDDACGCYGCCDECWNRIYEDVKGETK